MNLSVRSLLMGLAVGFALYFAARAIWWVEQPSAPLLMVGAIMLYLLLMIVAVLSGSASDPKLPLWWAIVCVLGSAVVPQLVSASLETDALTAPFATWYIGAVGLVAVVCIVRGRPVCGWLCLVALSVSSMTSLGMTGALQWGLLGSIVWVVVTQLLVWFWERAIRDTEELARIQQAVSAWGATQEVRQRERRLRVKFALAAAGPVLTRTVAAQGELSEDERLAARLAEGRLRDELRGANLLNDAVRDAIEHVRRAGKAVTVFDEGGIEDVSEERRTQIRDELAGVLRTAASDRIIIRAPRDSATAVTVVGRSKSASADDDNLELWHEIPREK